MAEEATKTLHLLPIQSQTKKTKRKSNSRRTQKLPFPSSLVLPYMRECRIRHLHFNEHPNEHFSVKKVE
jgi:hypothetical protein